MCCRRILVFLPLLCIGFALELPPDFDTCKRSDSDINGCLKEAIQKALPKLEKGIPEFNFPPIQPLTISSMTIGEGKGAVHVVQKFKNVKIYDIGRAKINNVEMKITGNDFDLNIDASLDEIKVEAEYDFNGRILVLPIVGTGPSVVVFKNIKAHVTLRGEEFIKKGKGYEDIKLFKVDLKPESINFNFKNLFNGDKRLGDEMNQLLTDNWKDIWEDVRVGYEESLGLILKNIANLIFKKVPHEVLFP